MSTMNRDRWSVRRFKQLKNELIEGKSALCVTLGQQRGRGGRRLQEKNRITAKTQKSEKIYAEK